MWRWSLLALALAGCPKEATPPAERTAPASPGAPLELAKPDEARIRLDLAAARAAIRAKQQLEGTFPASLDALEVRLHYPADLTYDPTSGTVKSRTYPSL